MNIKTKYDKGDKVWALYVDMCDHGTWHVNTEQKVCEVHCRNSHGWYCLEFESLVDLREEWRLFATEKEAQTECDKRNKEAKK